MLGLSVLVIAVVAAIMFVTFQVDNEMSPIGGYAYLGGIFALLVIIVRFFSNIRPLFSNGAVQGFGCSVGIVGVIVSISPLIIARATTPAGDNWMSEGSGGGSAIWLMMFSVPVGFIIGVVGLRIFNAASASAKKAMQNPDELGDLQ